MFEVAATDEMTKEVVEVETGGDGREAKRAEVIVGTTVTAVIVTNREIATSPNPGTGDEVVIEIAVEAAEIKTAIAKISREIGIKIARVAASEARAKTAITKANANEAKAKIKMVKKAQRRTRAKIARMQVKTMMAKMSLTQRRTKMGTIAMTSTKKRMVKIVRSQSQRKR